MTDDEKVLMDESGRELAKLREPFTLSLEPRGALIFSAIIKAALLDDAAPPPVIELGQAFLSGARDFFKGMPATSRLFDSNFGERISGQKSASIECYPSARTVRLDQHEDEVTCQCPVCVEIMANHSDLILIMSAWPLLQLVSLLKRVEADYDLHDGSQSLVTAIHSAARELFKKAPRCTDLLTAAVSEDDEQGRSH
jgi:hypothetical protein